MSFNKEISELNNIFYNILKRFDEFGSLRNIDPEFKSRLFEDFLKKKRIKIRIWTIFHPKKCN